MIGSTVSHYRIIDKLGEGGMGVVYKAEDTRLRRTVAVKFLHREGLEDAESRDRFRREAEAAAALDHPNICTVHEIEEADGHTFIVMAFCDGSSLKDRIRERPLPLAEALDIAIQIGEGLRVAHEKGVTHRDLKPANVAVTENGQVKLMDFGLAHLSGRTKLTRTGRQMGTPAYMSPEQAEGKAVDRRSDLWSLGVVVYEMVAGRLPFRGDTEAAVVHSILRADPEPVTALRAGLPLELDRVIGKALAKDAAERYQYAADLLVDLRKLRANLQQDSKADRRAAVAARRRTILAASVAGLALGVLASGSLDRLRRKAPFAPLVARFTIQLPPGEVISSQVRPAMALSPDGKHVAYVGNRAGRTQLYLRPIDEFESKAIAGTEGAAGPVFSPDGQWLAFFQNFKWKKVSLKGGPPVTFYDAPQDSSTRAAWGPDNNFVFDRFGFGFMRVSAAGGSTAQPLVTKNSEIERASFYPQFLPGGRALLFTLVTPDTDVYGDARIVVHSLETGQRKVLLEGGHRAWYSPSGHIIYVHSGTLLAVPFDLEHLAVTGTPVPVVDGVFESLANGNTHCGVSANGTLAYAPGRAISGSRRPVWVDRQGVVQPLPLPPRTYLHPRLSPDGKQVAIEVEGPNHNVFTYDLERGTLTKVTLDGRSHWPVWTPDGKRLTFRSERTGAMSMWWMPADRSAPEDRLTSIGLRQSASSWSPDGRIVAFTQISSETGGDVWVLEMDADRKPRLFAQTKFNEGSPRFSPDGRWIAYCSNESGRMEVFVQPYPGPGPKIQVSTEGGSDPTWKHNGGELYYRSGDKMMAVTVSTHPVFRAGRPNMLWERYFAYGRNSSCAAPGPSSSNYDVALDGQRFLMIQEGEDDAPATQIHVVVNWAEELMQRLKVGRL